MGYRIKKTLGYALTNVAEGGHYEEKESFMVPDVRFVDGIDIYDVAHDITINQLIEYGNEHDMFGRMGDHFERAVAQGETGSEPMSNLFHYSVDGEGGLQNVFQIVPPTMVQKWVRSDEEIDYYECQITHGEPTDEVKMVDSSLYPFQGYVNMRTMQPVDGDIISLMKWLEEKDEVLSDKQLEHFGLKDLDDVKNIAPRIPEIVRILMHYSGLFKDPDEVFKQLRPAIYTYWS